MSNTTKRSNSSITNPVDLDEDDIEFEKDVFNQRMRKMKDIDHGRVKEKKIQSDILKYLNAISGCKAIKVTAGPYVSVRGTPDLFVCYKGQMVVIEVKTLGGRLSVLQAEQLDRWRKAGAIALVASSLSDVQRLFSELRNDIPSNPVRSYQGSFSFGSE